MGHNSNRGRSTHGPKPLAASSPALFVRQPHARTMIDANSVAQGAMANGFSQGQAMQMAQQAMMDNAMLGMMQQMEQAVDDEMDRFENMTEEDLAKIRANRIKEMKQKAEQKQEWKNNGHGGMTRITDQKDFFAVTKQSERVVCLFNRESNRYQHQHQQCCVAHALR